jgi:hypothetical protein
MKNQIEFKAGVAIPKDLTPDTLGTELNKVKTLCETAKQMYEYGVNMDTTPEEKQEARDMVEQKKSYTSNIKPQVAFHLSALLDTYDKRVIDNATQVRTYITNKLLADTDSKDPKVRMKALELLGKVSEIGLFAERKEITIKHQSSEEIEERLREKLSKYIINADYKTVEEEKPEDKLDEPMELGSPDDELGDVDFSDVFIEPAPEK